MTRLRSCIARIHTWQPGGLLGNASSRCITLVFYTAGAREGEFWGEFGLDYRRILLPPQYFHFG
jgi:hypothetical protein